MKKENVYKFLYSISILLIIGFCIRVGADFFTYNPARDSAPFYVFAFVRTIEFIIPSAIIFVVAKIAKKKYN